MAAGIEQPEQQRAKQGKSEYNQGPFGGRFTSGQAHDNQGDQILHDQDADGDPAMERPQFPFGFKNLGGQHRARE